MRRRQVLIGLMIILITNLVTFGLTKSLLGYGSEIQSEDGTDDAMLRDGANKVPVFGIICVFVIILVTLFCAVFNINRDW